MNESQSTVNKIAEIINTLERSDFQSLEDTDNIIKPSLPSFDLIEKFMNMSLCILLPEAYSRYNDKTTVRASAENLYEIFKDILIPLFPNENIDKLIEIIILQYPLLREKLKEDVNAIYLSDPAATSHIEIIISYPGFLATVYYRVAHLFYTEKIPYLPRMISRLAHSKTGIDIHPGAEIGRAFAIDHGTGIVIGETARIGDRVRMYQGVTVGAKDVRGNNALGNADNKKRHPTIGNDCILCAGAIILGGDTVVGNGCIIAAGVMVNKSVPDGKTVTRL